jgi:hypothetical protein
MASLYADEDFPQPVVSRLIDLGHDVLTPSDTRQRNLSVPDEQVVEIAIRLERAVLTFNRWHFISIHSRNPDHRGIITCTQDSNFEALARRIHEAILANEPLAGKLIRVVRAAVSNT